MEFDSLIHLAKIKLYFRNISRYCSIYFIIRRVSNGSSTEGKIQPILHTCNSWKMCFVKRMLH